MASMGSLVVNLGANTRQFDSAIARSQQAMQSFGKGAAKAAEAAHSLDVLTMGTGTAAQLQEVALKMTDLQTATQMAATQARNFEQAAHQVSAAVTVAGAGMVVASKGAVSVAKGASVASTGMHSVVIAAIAVRRTLESLAWAFGVVADGAKVLLAPLRIMARAIGILLIPFKVLGSAVMVFARAVGVVIGPILSLAGGVFTLWTYFKAFQLQIKLTQAILGMLPPKVRAVATVLFGIGLASRAASMSLRMLGTAGQWMAAALRLATAPVRALLSPLKTLEAAAKRAGSAISGFIGSALTPLRLAMSGLGAVAAVGGMLKLAADAETLALRMKVLTKDANVAAKLVEDLNAFALTVPFDKMDIRSAATQLLAVQTPVGELLGDMQVLANLAAGSGQSITELTDIFATFRSQGTIGMQDILQLQRRGINVVPELTAKFGDLEAALEAGRIGFHDVRAALYTLTTGTGQFAGMTDELAKSMAGQFAQLKNNILIVATAIGEQMRPAITAALDQVNKFIQAFMGIKDKVGFIQQVFGAAFDVAFAYIEEKWDELLKRLAAKAAGAAPKIGMHLIPGLPQLATLLGGLRGGNAAPAAGPGLAEAQAKLSGLLDALKPKPGAARPAPVASPAPPPGAGAAVGKNLGVALGQFVEGLKGDAAPVVNGLVGWMNNKLLAGAMAVNKFSQMGGERGEGMTQEKRVAGAIQKGSAEAYSAIVSAMLGRGDPVVKATQQQTKELKKPLVDLVGLIQKGGVVGLLEAFTP
jgi:hypothetical protein